MFGLYVLFKGVFFLLLRPLPWSWSWLLALPGKPSEALNHCSSSLLGMRSSVMALPGTVFASWMVPLYMKSRKIILQTTRPCALQYHTCASWKLIASGSLLDMGLVCTRLILIVLWLSFKKVLWSLLNLSTTCPSLFYRELIRYLFLKKSHSWTLQMNLVLVSSMLRGMQLARAHNRFNILPLKVLSRQVLLHSWTEDLQTCPFSSAILQEWTKRTTKRM